MNLELFIPIADIEHKVNDVLKETLYKGDVADYEGIEVVVKKRDRFRLRSELNTIFIEAPIRAEVNIGQSALRAWFKGIVKSIEELDVDITVILEIAPDINTKWQITPKIRSRYVWDKEPNFTIAGIPLPIKKILEVVLESQIRNTSKTIEKYIKEDLRVEQYVKMGWDIMHESLAISDDYPIRILFNPAAYPIYATPLRCEKGGISATVSVPVYPEAVIGTTEINNEITPPLPDFEAVKQLPASKEVLLSGKIFYRFIEEFLKEKTFDGDGKIQKIIIHTIRFEERGGQLFIPLSLAIKGKGFGISLDMPLECEVKARLLPNKEKGIIIALDDLKIKEGSTWIKLLYPLQKHSITHKLQETLQNLADKYWYELQEMLMNTLRNRNLGKYLVLNVEANTFQLTEVQIEEKYLSAHVTANVSPSLKIGNF